MPDDYWTKRKAAEDQWIKDNLADDDKFQQWMQGKFDKALTEIQRDIDSEYQKYGGGDNLTMKQAIRRVSAEDVKGYQDKAAEIVAEAQRLRKEKGAPLTKSDFTDEVNNQLRLYNATMRINRLEMLKSKIGLELTQANMNVDAELKSRLVDGYQDEIKRQAGILGETIPMTSVSSAIGYTNASIDGATFSQRIWANQAALKGQLDDLVTRAVIRGENPRKIAPWLKDQIKQTVDNRRYVTERIARTEMARVQDDAQTESFKRYGYDYCKWVAEPSACTICREIASENDGVYKVSEVPTIPVHANCRCSKAAWYGESKKNVSNETSLFKDVSANTLKDHANYIKDLPDKLRDAIVQYTGPAYQRWNSILRTGSQASIQDLQDIDSLTETLNHPVGQDVNLYRGVLDVPDKIFDEGNRKRLNYVLQKMRDIPISDEDMRKLLAPLIGHKFRDDAFMSSSSSAIVAKNFSNGIIFKLRAAKGTNGLSVKSVSKYSGEDEVLLQRGSKVTITGVHYSEDGSKLILEGDVSNDRLQ